MIKTLRRRFIAVAMLSLFCVLLLLMGTINTLNYRSVIREADGTLETLGNNGGAFPVEPGSPSGPGREDGTVPPGGVKPLRPGGRDRDAELPFQSRYFTLTYAADGTLTETDLENVAAISETEAAALGQTALELRRSRGFLRDYRYLRQELESGTRLIFLDCRRELSTFREFLWVSVGISAGGLLLVFLLICLLSGRIVRPISESYEKQKQFITDAGHELKTPITIINADAEILEQDLPDSEWLRDIRAQTGRLGKLTNDLVYLSRMEENGGRLRYTEVDLSQLAEDTARGFQAPAVTRGQTLTHRIQPELTVWGDESALGKLISILLDNAVKYTPAGGNIHLTLERTGRQLRLAVTNDTEGMEKEQLSRLFDRFYRTDASRSSETGGYGLGLSIARAVVTAHKGRISALSPDGRRLTLEALLPESRG